jgi:hypothetical protein
MQPAVDITLRRRMNGAALAIGLILLLAISLIAIASMNLDKFNIAPLTEQQQRIQAFQAADSAINLALQEFPAAMFAAAAKPAPVASYVVEPIPDAESRPLYGYSLNSLDSRYFSIRAVGKSEQTQITLEQEVFVVMPSSDAFTYDARRCASTASLEAEAANC